MQFVLIAALIAGAVLMYKIQDQTETLTESLDNLPDEPGNLTIVTNDDLVSDDPEYMSDVHESFGVFSMSYTLPKRGEPYRQLIIMASEQFRVPFELLAAQLDAESGFKPDAVSSVGAQGIAQFMPKTARDFGINPFDPEQAILAQAKYMRSLYTKTGSWSRALAAYNWGIGNVTRKGTANMPDETVAYVNKITANSGIA